MSVPQRWSQDAAGDLKKQTTRGDHCDYRRPFQCLNDLQVPVCERITNRDDGALFRKEKLHLPERVMGRDGKSTNGQPRVGFEILATTSFYSASHSRTQFFADQIAQALVLLDNENMIRALGKQPFAHALPKLLKGITVFASPDDGSVNEVVQRHAIGLSLA